MFIILSVECINDLKKEMQTSYQRTCNELIMIEVLLTSMADSFKNSFPKSEHRHLFLITVSVGKSR